MPILPENQPGESESSVIVKKLCADVHAVKGNQAAQQVLIQDLSDKLERNTSMTADNTGKLDALTQSQAESRADSVELLEIFRAVRGTLKVLGWIGNVLKWILPIVGGILGIIYASKGGGPHQ